MNAKTPINVSLSWLSRRAQSATLFGIWCALLIGALSVSAQPTTVTTAPTEPAGHVISLYTSSQVYSDVPGVNFYEEWWGGQWTGHGDYTIPATTSVVKGYQGLLFTGVGFENTPTNVAGCEVLHVDVYTPNGDQFAVRLVDRWGNAADVVYNAAGGVIVPNTWVSLDIPLVQFQAAQPALNLTSVKQLGWIINTAGAGTSPADYYIDNVYFKGSTNLVFTAGPVTPRPAANAPTPARPASSVKSLYNSGAVYPNHAGINWYPWGDAVVHSDYTITGGNTVKRYEALKWYGVELGYGGNAVDASAYSALHVDVWTTANQLGIKLVSTAGASGNQAAEVQYLASGGVIATNQWVSLDIPLAAFKTLNPGLDLAKLDQLLWIDNGELAGPGIQAGDFYFDNVYFWTTNQVQASIGTGSQVSWIASVGNTYQPQESANGSTWANLGGVISGAAVTSVFDATPVANYRVLEMTSGAMDKAVNGGMETAGANTTGALGWDVAGGGGAIATAQRSSVDPHSGAYALDLEAQGNGASGAAAIALQNGIPVGPGPVAITFYAKGALMEGGANPQYQVWFYDTLGNPLPGSPVNGSFMGSLTANYSLQTINVTAPESTDHAQLLFNLAGGAGVGDHWLVRIDDVAFSVGGTPVTNTLPAVVQPAVGISWQSAPGLTYGVESRASLDAGGSWSPLGGNVTATATTTTVPDGMLDPKKFYRVLELY